MTAQMSKDLQTLKAFMQEHGLPFQIVGSLALAACGIDLKREPGDIDVEVATTSACHVCLFQGMEQLNGEGNAPYDNKSCYRFKVGQTEVNVFVVEELSHNYVMRQGIRYSIIMDVFKKKMAYKRKKDYADLVTLISDLTSLAKE